MTREELEREALQQCPAELYYDLADTIDATPDYELQALLEPTK